MRLYYSFCGTECGCCVLTVVIILLVILFLKCGGGAPGELYKNWDGSAAGEVVFQL